MLVGGDALSISFAHQLETRCADKRGLQITSTTSTQNQTFAPFPYVPQLQTLVHLRVAKTLWPMNCPDGGNEDQTRISAARGCQSGEHATMSKEALNPELQAALDECAALRRTA